MLLLLIIFMLEENGFLNVVLGSLRRRELGLRVHPLYTNVLNDKALVYLYLGQPKTLSSWAVRWGGDGNWQGSHRAKCSLRK